MTPDVNVLVAADRGEHPHHVVALEWLQTAVAEATPAAPLTVLPMVAVGYVRIATNPKIQVGATPLARALGNVARLLAAPNVRLAGQREEWPVFAELCTQHQLAGAVVSDAWIAASVLHLHEHLVAFDRGFRRLLPPRHLTVLAP